MNRNEKKKEMKELNKLVDSVCDISIRIIILNLLHTKFTRSLNRGERFGIV